MTSPSNDTFGNYIINFRRSSTKIGNDLSSALLLLIHKRAQFSGPKKNLPAANPSWPTLSAEKNTLYQIVISFKDLGMVLGKIHFAGQEVRSG
jgi:hypothetical protein